MIRILTALAFAAIAAHAQTAVRPGQLAAPSAPQPRVIVFLPNGEAKIAELGPGLVLDLSNPAAPVLRVERGLVPTPVPTPSPGPVTIRDAFEITKPIGPLIGLVLKQTPINEPLIFANGLLLEKEFDYTRNGVQITLSRPYTTGENLMAFYRW